MDSRKRTEVVILLVAVSLMIVILSNVIRQPTGTVPPPVGIPDSMPRPVRRPFRAGDEMVYVLVWKGAACGDLRIGLQEEEKEGTTYLVAKYEGQTRRDIALIWSYRMSGKTYLDRESLLPAFATRTSGKTKKQKRYETSFDRKTHTAHVVKEKLYKKSHKEYDVKFRMGLDLVGALFYARAIDLQIGKTAVLEILHEDKIYTAELSPAKREKVEVKAGTFDTLAVDIRLRMQGGTEEERNEEKNKFRRIRVWFSDDDRRLPIKMESEVFVGAVSAELVSASP